MSDLEKGVKVRVQNKQEQLDGGVVHVDENLQNSLVIICTLEN